MADILENPNFELINSEDQIIRAQKKACTHSDNCGIDFDSGCGMNDTCIVDFT